MGRKLKDLYCFITDDNKKFVTAVQKADGSYVTYRNSAPYPISYNPSNLMKAPIEFSTNLEYFSMFRYLTFPLDFIKDGAHILREAYNIKKGIEENLYLTIVQWDGAKFALSYYGKFQFSQKKDDPKTGTFTIPTVDESCWGILSQKDKVVYSIECNQNNPKAVKVLIDAPVLVNRYTFQTVQSPITDYNADNVHTIPFLLVNEDGDSYGITTKNQTLQSFSNWPALAATSPVWFFSSLYPLNNVRISGTFTFAWSTNTLPSGGLIIYFYTSTGQKVKIFDMPGSTGNLIPGKIYSVNFDFLINLAVSENIFFLAELNDNAARLFTITPIVTNISIDVKTRPEPSVVYGIRAIDLLKQIVDRATLGKYTINSNFLTDNKYDVILSGDSIRGISTAKIYTNLNDFFKTFTSIYMMSFRDVKGNLFLEKSTDVYSQNSNLLDLGDLIDYNSVPAEEFYANELIAGSPDQDYRHPSGRLEFNSENSFSLPFLTIDKKLELVTKYRTGCYDITFLILDYKGNSSVDNTGDKSNYMLRITDQIGSAKYDVETFENINIDNAPLEPIIKSPLNGDYINYNKPTLKGIAPTGSNVNIYIDGSLDGNTVADANGNWIYEVNTALSSYNPGVNTGEHIIDVTYTDELAPKSTINIVVDTTVPCQTNITYPQPNDYLYNNKPLIKGVAQNGTNINIFIDGVLAGTTVADNSCKWSFKSNVIPNGVHLIEVDTQSVSFEVEAFTAYPLITYIGSELDGFILINNLPLIQGVGIPGTVFSLWLNYITYAPLGNVTVQPDGTWSFQVIPTNYTDPSSGIGVVLAPIRNGLSVISTSLINHIVSINVSGFSLERPNFSSITGVTDNTVFNTYYSPKRMIANNYPLLASIMQQQKNTKIIFEQAKKNGNLSTTLNGVTITENTSIKQSELGNPLMMLEYAEIKTSTKSTFSKTLYNFSQGGFITGMFRGTKLYFLPIGSMKMDNLTSEVQEWKLMLSPLNSFYDLMNLYKQGTTIKLMENAIYHSDYNSLHLVRYGFVQQDKYNFKTIYDDWFENRNDAWALNPNYIQKFQKEQIKDQIITNGVGDLEFNLYDCKNGYLIDTIPYIAVNPAPINPPDIVLEVSIDLSLYPSGQYFGVISASGVPVGIFERFETKDKWSRGESGTNTILIEATNSINKTGFFYSTGIKSIVRVEGLVKKLQPNMELFTATEENGDSEMLYSVVSRMRDIQFGTAYGLPDYLYLKIADILAVDNLLIEGVGYTISQDEKIAPSDDVNGHPLYYYNVKMLLKDNQQGVTIGAEESSDVSSVVLTVDSEAVGLPSGTLFNIKLNNT